MLLIRVCSPSPDICVCNQRQSAEGKHTTGETAQDTRNDIVEVKNLSGRPQQYSSGSPCVKLGVYSVCVSVCMCVEAGDGV